MRRFLRTTWLPTAAFAALSQLPRGDCGSAYGPFLAALAITPFAWFFYVSPSGTASLRRAALAGSTCAFLASLLVYESNFVLFTVGRAGSVNSGDFAGGLADAFVIGFSLLLHAPAGAVVGLIVAWLQEHVALASGGSRLPGSPLRNRVITSSMIAILAAPFVAILAAQPLSSLIWRFLPHAIGLSPYLVVTWLVTVPTAAWMGRSFVTRSPRGVAPSPHE